MSYKTKTWFNSIAENRRPVQKLVRKLTYFWTNVRTSAAVCKFILTNVHKLVRKSTYSLTNVCTSATIFILIRTGWQAYCCSKCCHYWPTAFARAQTRWIGQAGPPGKIAKHIHLFTFFPAHGKMPEMAWNWARSIFPTNPDLATFWVRRISILRNFYVWA